MTELMTRVLSAIPDSKAVRADWLSMQVGATKSGTISALHRLQDADLVYLRNGFYRLSEAANAARVDEMLRLLREKEAGPMTPAQRKTYDKVRIRVKSMRQGGQPDEIIRAGLLAEGWPARAVIDAMKVSDMTRPGNVEHET